MTKFDTLSAPDDPTRAQAHENIDQFLKQLHADYDPVYNMLMNYSHPVEGKKMNRIMAAGVQQMNAAPSIFHVLSA